MQTPYFVMLFIGNTKLTRFVVQGLWVLLTMLTAIRKLLIQLIWYNTISENKISFAHVKSVCGSFLMKAMAARVKFFICTHSLHEPRIFITSCVKKLRCSIVHTRYKKSSKKFNSCKKYV